MAQNKKYNFGTDLGSLVEYNALQTLAFKHRKGEPKVNLDFQVQEKIIPKEINHFKQVCKRKKSGLDIYHVNRCIAV